MFSVALGWQCPLVEHAKPHALGCLLCTPTDRAAKRLSDTTGVEAKTIHRLLEVNPGSGGFTRNESCPLDMKLDRLHRVIQIAMGWTDSQVNDESELLYESARRL